MRKSVGFPWSVVRILTGVPKKTFSLFHMPRAEKYACCVLQSPKEIFSTIALSQRSAWLVPEIFLVHLVGQYAWPDHPTLLVEGGKGREW